MTLPFLVPLTAAVMGIVLIVWLLRPHRKGLPPIVHIDDEMADQWRRVSPERIQGIVKGDYQRNGYRK